MLMFQIDKITIMSKTYIIIKQNVICSQSIELNQKSIYIVIMKMFTRLANDIKQQKKPCISVF